MADILKQFVTVTEARREVRLAKAAARAMAKDCDRRLLPLLKAAEDMDAYWPTIMPSPGVIPNKKILALRAAIAAAKS